jgi:hypothetical protein
MKSHRAFPASANNPFITGQQQCSKAMVDALT